MRNRYHSHSWRWLALLWLEVAQPGTSALGEWCHTVDSSRAVWNSTLCGSGDFCHCCMTWLTLNTMKRFTTRISLLLSLISHAGMDIGTSPVFLSCERARWILKNVMDVLTGHRCGQDISRWVWFLTEEHTAPREATAKNTFQIILLLCNKHFVVGNKIYLFRFIQSQVNFIPLPPLSLLCDKPS